MASTESTDLLLLGGDASSFSKAPYTIFLSPSSSLCAIRNNLPFFLTLSSIITIVPSSLRVPQCVNTANMLSSRLTRNVSESSLETIRHHASMDTTLTLNTGYSARDIFFSIISTPRAPHIAISTRICGRHKCRQREGEGPDHWYRSGYHQLGCGRHGRQGASHNRELGRYEQDHKERKTER